MIDDGLRGYPFDLAFAEFAMKLSSFRGLALLCANSPYSSMLFIIENTLESMEPNLLVQSRDTSPEVSLDSLSRAVIGLTKHVMAINVINHDPT